MTSIYRFGVYNVYGNILTMLLALLQIIRELREEVEKLRNMIGVGGPGGGGGQDSKGIKELAEKLRISESLMSEMTKSWEQRLQDTQRIHQERQKALEDMGISVQAAGIGVQKDKFYLVNLNADPSMNELLVCYLKVSKVVCYHGTDDPVASYVN